jgi:hypothetical protein
MEGAQSWCQGSGWLDRVTMAWVVLGPSPSRLDLVLLFFVCGFGFLTCVVMNPPKLPTESQIWTEMNSPWRFRNFASMGEMHDPHSIKARCLFQRWTRLILSTQITNVIHHSFSSKLYYLQGSLPTTSPLLHCLYCSSMYDPLASILASIHYCRGFTNQPIFFFFFFYRERAL